MTVTDELVGITEIAQRQHTTPGYIRVLRKRSEDFPVPIAVIAGKTPVWRLADIDAWFAARGRRNGG